MRLEKVIVLPLVCLAVLAFAGPGAETASARPPDDVCGLQPGEGAYNYVKVWNTSCRRARRVSRKAGDKFCRDQGCDAMPGEHDSGRVEVGQWHCRMRVGYEDYRARCHNSGKRFVHKSGA